MTGIKLILLLITLSLFSCTTKKKHIIAKWENGKPKIERVYSDTPNVFTEKEYYENGQLASETKFIDSIKNGASIAYYKDGKFLGKSFNKNGKINGEVTEFHRTGNLMFKGVQEDGDLIGTAIHYYDNGKPETELYYNNGKVFLVNYWDSSNVQQIVNGNGVKKFKDYLNKDKNGAATKIKVFVAGNYQDSVCNGVWKYYDQIDNKLVLERNFEDNKITSETWK